MISVLLLGFLIGMRHAVEADHVAAVAAISARSQSLNQALRQGATWGLGHTLALLMFGSLVLVLEWVIPELMAQWLELAVGLMLLCLGADLLHRLWREKVHFHLHHHPGQGSHFHAHSHAGENEHDPKRHPHKHVKGLEWRALLVGLMHGMAGSAALILLTLQTVHTPWQGLAYIALFGVGSIVGMALLSLAIAYPLRYSSRAMTGLYNGLQALVAVFTLLVGSWMVLEIGGPLLSA